MYEISQGRSILPELGFTINPVVCFGVFSLFYAYFLFIYFHVRSLCSRGSQKDTMILRGLLGLWWQSVGAIDWPVCVFKLP